MHVSFTIIRVIIINIRVIVVYTRNRIMKFRVTATNIRLHSWLEKKYSELNNLFAKMSAFFVSRAERVNHEYVRFYSFDFVTITKCIKCFVQQSLTL